MPKFERLVLIILGLSLLGHALAVCNDVGLTFSDTNCRWCAIPAVTQEVHRTHVVYENRFGNCATRISSISYGPCSGC
jgi:hypothetical protein